MSIFEEIKEEYQDFVKKSGNVIDSVLAPIVFAVVNAFAGLQTASIVALVFAAAVAVYRYARKQDAKFAVSGLLVVAVAIGLARATGSAQGYFLPGIFAAAITVGLCVVTVLAKKPLVALSSYAARQWPLEWYWHPKVRPAYSEVTIVWGVYFAAKAFIRYTFYSGADISQLTVVQLATGWPATVVLLAFSYAYGRWRLLQLKGPSVEQFEKEAPETEWTGQPKGF